MGYKRKLLPLPTELGLVSRTSDPVPKVLKLYRAAFINSSMGGYKVAALIRIHAWARFSILRNALHDPHEPIRAYDPTRYPDLFPPAPSSRFILIHDYWSFHTVSRSFLWPRREVRLMIGFYYSRTRVDRNWELLLTGVLVDMYAHP